jgi:hypothetical protein
MNKKFTRSFIGWLSFFLFMLFMHISISAQSDKPVADGSFIQSWFCYSWSEERWQKEFEILQEAGMHYLVLQSTSQSTIGEPTVTYYQSSLPNTTPFYGLNGEDMIEKCLKVAQQMGIKVFIGLSFNDKWWEEHGGDAEWLYEQMEFDNSMCDELWDKFKTKYPDAFYGWYWSYEASNVAFSTATQQDELAKAMNIQLDHLAAVNKKLPFMWAPFMNSAFNSAEENAAMWQNVFDKLHITDGDIFCPQDCVGAGGLKIDEVVHWFSLLREAVDTRPGLLFWSDVEIFTSNYGIAPVKRFVNQLEIEQPYVENYLTFAYSHYYSPLVVDPGYHKTYVDYVNTGILDNSAPSVPGNYTAVLKFKESIELTWTPSTDNVALAGYYIYRNGSRISTISSDTVFVDGGLSSNTEYTYKINAFDYAGNNSEFTSEITIKTGEIAVLANNLSKGKYYSVSIPANEKYPDSNKELTNGGYARTTSLADPSWEAFYGSTPRSIIIDLESITDVQQFYADFLFNRNEEVYLPQKIELSVSSDAQNYAYIGDMSVPNVSEEISAKAFKCAATLEQPVKARYVKFRVTPRSSLTFDDEYEVRSSGTTYVDNENTAPKEYILEQNYPNPFNPSTIISYQVPCDGYVSLVLYNVLGKEVKKLVSANQTAGKYDYTLDAGELSSGVYFYKLTAGNYTSVKKLIKLK